MRTLHADLTAAQKEAVITPLYKIVLGATTYEQDRIISIDHLEEPSHQSATVVLNNWDRAVTTNFKGVKGIISYGMGTASGDRTSATAPMWVVGQESRSAPGMLTVTLSLVGLAAMLAEDKANTEQDLYTEDRQTVKD